MKKQTLQNAKYEIQNTKAKAFSLVEITTALIILAFISASVLVVINRCVVSATDSTLRMQAFEVARENMEKLLTSDSLKEAAEFGTSDKYPEIQWQTLVETFYEPITQRVWVRGVCSAEYTDSAGETQTVELTHWLTDVTKKQLLELLKRQEDEDARLAEQLIETVEEAAEYAGVDVATIEQWIENGLLATEDGSFIKDNIDIFKQSDGNPTPEEKSQQAESVEDLIKPTEDKQSEQETTEIQDWLNEIDPLTGLTYGELEEMDFLEIWELLMKLKNEGKL